MPGRIIVHWLDSFGAAYSVPPRTGTIRGDTLEFTVPYPDGTFRDRIVFRGDGSWHLPIEAAQPDGRWRAFAEYDVRAWRRAGFVRRPR